MFADPTLTTLAAITTLTLDQIAAARTAAIANSVEPFRHAQISRAIVAIAAYVVSRETRVSSGLESLKQKLLIVHDLHHPPTLSSKRVEFQEVLFANVPRAIEFKNAVSIYLDAARKKGDRDYQHPFSFPAHQFSFGRIVTLRLRHPVGKECSLVRAGDGRARSRAWGPVHGCDALAVIVAGDSGAPQAPLSRAVAMARIIGPKPLADVTDVLESATRAALGQSVLVTGCHLRGREVDPAPRATSR